ncbi:hypothetical protein [Terasakiella sp. SH-1]|uniref:hypothetical protein n=1 Tax=Terasakiella sp. SH-1 TaxID=2560057 RepID=UPI0010740A90|nr:hypothetical protein [Terasakiella sp. SH-1]
MQAVFDEFGRAVPGQVKGAVQQKVRRYFRCDQPELDLDAIYGRIQAVLGEGSLSCEAFKSRVAALIQGLERDAAHCGILKGVYVPFYIPQRDTKDIGRDIGELYLPALAQSFTGKCPDYDFKKHDQKQLEGNLSIVAGAKHGRLLEKLATQDVVGLYFPALDGYSLEAAREQVAFLPQSFSLAGGADTCAAMIGSPDLLLRQDGYPPLLWFGGLEAEDPSENVHLEAYGYDLTFNRRVHLGNADEYWANGIVVSD